MVTACINFLNNLKSTNENPEKSLGPYEVQTDNYDSNQSMNESEQEIIEQHNEPFEKPMQLVNEVKNLFIFDSDKNLDPIVSMPTTKFKFTARQQPALNLRFKGEHLEEYKEFKTLINEIKKYKPNAYIQQANIATKENETTLYITTNNRESFEILSTKWPQDAFRSGIELVESKLKYFFAISGASRKNNLDCQDDLDDLKDDYGLSNLTRILNSKKEPTTIVKAEVDCERNLVRIVYHHKVNIWTFKAMICYKCQMPGHISKNCHPEIKQVCKHCGEEHSFKECVTRKNKENIFCKACNLKNDHESGDKRCPKMIINFNKRNQSYASIAAKNNINPISKNETYRLTSKTATFPHTVIPRKLTHRVKSRIRHLSHGVTQVLTPFLGYILPQG